MSKAQYLQMANEAADKHGVPLPVLAGLIHTESAWNPQASARANGLGSSAYGLGQFTKGTAKQYGVDTKDPASSIDGSARYLRDLHKKFGDWSLAVRAYHDGPGAVDQMLQGKGGNTSAEAQEYVGKVFSAAKAYGPVPTDNTPKSPSLLTGAAIPVANPASKNPAVKALKLAPVSQDTPSPLPLPTLVQSPQDAGPAPLGLAPMQMAAAPQPTQPLAAPAFDMQTASLDPQPQPKGLTSLLEGAFGSLDGKGGNMLKPTRPRGYDGMLDRLIG